MRRCRSPFKGLRGTVTDLLQHRRLQLQNCNILIYGRYTTVTMSKVVRIDEEALAIALGYGDSLSAGVKKMAEIIAKTEKARADYEKIERMIRSTIQEELETLTRY